MQALRAALMVLSVLAICGAAAARAESAPAANAQAAQGGPGSESARDEYARRCRDAKAAPETADYVALRRSYVAAWGSFGMLAPGGLYELTRDLFARLSAARQAGDAKGAERLLNELLSIDFGNPAAQAFAVSYFEASGRPSEAALHRDVRARIVQAILASGDGRSAETAYPVTGIGEEYMIMRLLGLKAHGQALATKRGGRYDILFVDPDDPGAGDRREVWFKLPW